MCKHLIARYISDIKCVRRSVRITATLLLLSQMLGCSDSRHTEVSDSPSSSDTSVDYEMIAPERIEFGERGDVKSKTHAERVTFNAQNRTAHWVKPEITYQGNDGNQWQVTAGQATIKGGQHIDFTQKVRIKHFQQTSHTPILTAEMEFFYVSAKHRTGQSQGSVHIQFPDGILVGKQLFIDLNQSMVSLKNVKGNYERVQ